MGGPDVTQTHSAAHGRSQEEQLQRSVTGRLLFFYVLGDVLGSGIYALIGIMAFEVGGALWMSFVVGVSIALLTGFAYAELITKHPQAAGASLYVHKAFGRRPLTFLVTFCLLAATIAAAGALSLTFGGEYFAEFIEGVEPKVIAIVFIVLLSLLNFRGISESVVANMVMTLIETTGLLIILVIGGVVLAQGDADLSQPFELNDGNAALVVLGGAAIAFFAMTGFENAANIAEETRDPSRVFPRALLGGMALAGLLYLLIAFVASMVAPLEELTANGGEDGNLLTVVEAGPIPIPGLVFAAIALVAVTNTTLVSLVAQSRIMYGMARQGVVPRIFARTHHSRHTPWIAIVFTAALVIVLLLTADVGTLADVTVLFLITVYGMVCLAALVLRRQPVDHEHYRAPTWLLVLGLVGNVALLLYTAIDGTINREPGEPAPLLYCGVMLAVGVGLYFVNNLFTQGDPQPMAEETLAS
jgi:APA family basic amino acid/polyamine antiporter